MVSEIDRFDSESVDDVVEESADEDLAASLSEERFRRKKVTLEITKGNTPFDPQDVTSCLVSQRKGRRTILSRPLVSADPKNLRIAKNRQASKCGPTREGGPVLLASRQQLLGSSSNERTRPRFKIPWEWKGFQVDGFATDPVARAEGGAAPPLSEAATRHPTPFRRTSS
jgi:hypothetical protein